MADLAALVAEADGFVATHGDDVDGYEVAGLIRRLAAALEQSEQELWKYTDPPELVRKGETDVTMRHPLLAIVLQTWIEAFDDFKGSNYIEGRAVHPERGEFVVTIRRADGKTPHELKQEAEKKLEQSESRAERLEQACGLLDKAACTNHMGHFDPTGNRGAGCPECIRIRHLHDEADKFRQEAQP